VFDEAKSSQEQGRLEAGLECVSVYCFGYVNASQISRISSNGCQRFEA